MNPKIVNFTSCVTSLACNQLFIAVGLYNGTIELYDLKMEKMVRSWAGNPETFLELIFTSDGGLVSGSWYGWVKKWNLETKQDEVSTPKEQWLRRTVRPIHSLTEISSERLAVGCDDGTVCLLDMSTGLSPLQGGVCRGHTSWVSTVISLGVVGDRVGSFASGSDDGTICVWNTSSIGGTSATQGETASPGVPRRVVEVGNSVRSLSLSPMTLYEDGGGEKVVAGCYDGSVHLYCLPEWNLVWKAVKVHINSIFSLTFSPDGRFIASGSCERLGLVKILSTKTGAVLRTLEGHTDWITSVLFSHNDFSVISGSSDKTVRVWRLVEQDDRIASLLSGRTPSDLVYQGGDVLKQLFFNIRTKLI